MADQRDRDPLDERMDVRLQRHGARWREALPAPAEPAPVGSFPRRRWPVPVAAAAAVAVVVGLTFALTAEDRSADPGPAEEPTSAPPSDTAPPSDAAPCRRGDLVATDRRLEGAAGTTYLTMTIVLARGAEPCMVEGYPEVVLMEHGVLAPVEVVHDGPDTAKTLVVASGRPVAVVIAWALSHHCRPIDNDTIVIRMGDDAEVRIDGFGQTSCNPGEGEQSVLVRPFMPVEPNP